MALSVTIQDDDLDRKLSELAKRQNIPVSKRAFIKAVLLQAVKDGRGAPIEKWRDNVSSFVRANTQQPPSPADSASASEATPGPSLTHASAEAAGPDIPPTDTQGLGRTPRARRPRRRRRGKGAS